MVGCVASLRPAALAQRARTVRRARALRKVPFSPMATVTAVTYVFLSTGLLRLLGPKTQIMS